MEQFLNSRADVNVPNALDDQTPLIQAAWAACYAHVLMYVCTRAIGIDLQHARNRCIAPISAAMESLPTAARPVMEGFLAPSCFQADDDIDAGE